jgi:hypothetical protein
MALAQAKPVRPNHHTKLSSGPFLEKQPTNMATQHNNSILENVFNFIPSYPYTDAGGLGVEIMYTA